MLNVVVLNVIILSVVMLSAIVLSVVMLSVIMLSVVMLSVVAPVQGACTTKHYGFVTYRKLTDFGVCWCLLTWSNTLAYYGVLTL
jgi:hypothetical protein